MIIKSLRILSIAAGLSAVPALADIDTTTSPDRGNFIPFGSPNSTTYGQTFTVAEGDGLMTGFSIYLRGRPPSNAGSGTLDLRGYLATWSGSRADTLLHTTGSQTMNANALLQEFAFTFSAPVVAGQRYVAFISIAGLGTQPRNLFGTPATDNVIGGEFVFSNTGFDFGALFTSDWESLAPNDIFFKASFEPAPVTGVPEPSTWALSIAGLGLAGTSLRRRRRIAA